MLETITKPSQVHDRRAVPLHDAPQLVQLLQNLFLSLIFNSQLSDLDKSAVRVEIMTLMTGPRLWHFESIDDPERKLFDRLFQENNGVVQICICDTVSRKPSSKFHRKGLTANKIKAIALVL